MRTGSIIDFPRRSASPPADISKTAVYGSFGGAILGSMLWLIILALIARDWFSAAGVLVTTTGIFVLATHRVVQRGQEYRQVALWTLIGLCLVTLVVINGRWEAWAGRTQQAQSSAGTLAEVNLTILGLYAFVAALVANIPRGRD